MSWPRPGASAGAGAAASRGPLGRSRSTRHLAPQHDDRRLSRDDLYLLGPRRTGHGAPSAVVSAAGAPPAATAAFHVPLRSHPTQQQQHGPEATARTAPSPPAAADDSPIGMALGSPVHSPVPRPSHASAWPSPVEPAPAPAPAIITTTVTGNGGGSVQRSRTTRRKLFGLFGGGGGSSSSSSPAATTPTGVSAATAATAPATASASAPAERPVAQRSGTIKKHQPLGIRNEPPASEPASASSPSTSAPSPAPTTLRRAETVQQTAARGPLRPFLQRTNKDRPRPHGGMAAATMHSGGGGGGGGGPSFLDHVEIPDIHMERYSVMFGSLLHPGTGRGNQSNGGQGHGQSTDSEEHPLPAGAASASSLLARRQATLDRLRTINGRADEAAEPAGPYLKVGGGLQRRATSPSTTARSPSAYSLFPGRSPRPDDPAANEERSSPAMVAAAAMPSPRFRSNTSPAAPTMTPTSLFATDQRWRRQQQLMQRHPPNPLRENPINMAGAGGGGPDYPLLTSPEALDDGKGDEDEDEEVSGDVSREARTTTPFKPVLPEPQWQMVPPPPRTPAEEAAPKEAEDDDLALRRAVEMSIARQISVSRLQRQLLVPRRQQQQQQQQSGPGPTGPPAASGTPTPAPASRSPPAAAAATALPVRAATLRLGRHERLQATKTATPTLVVSSPSSASASSSSALSSAALSPPSGYADAAQAQLQRPALQLAQNRRSERVVLEAA